jgi:hypothetical protein
VGGLGCGQAETSAKEASKAIASAYPATRHKAHCRLMWPRCQGICPGVLVWTDVVAVSGSVRPNGRDEAMWPRLPLRCLALVVLERPAQPFPNPIPVGRRTKCFNHRMIAPWRVGSWMFLFALSRISKTVRRQRASTCRIAARRLTARAHDGTPGAATTTRHPPVNATRATVGPLAAGTAAITCRTRPGGNVRRSRSSLTSLRARVATPKPPGSADVGG